MRAMLNKAIVLTREGDLAGANRLHEASLAIGGKSATGGAWPSP